MRSSSPFTEIALKFLLLAIACFPIFSLEVGGLLIILWVVLSIFHWVAFNRKAFDKANWKWLIQILPYLALVLALTQTNNFKAAEFSLVQKLSLLFFPVAFQIGKDFYRDATYVRFVQYAFAATIVLVHVISQVQYAIYGPIDIPTGYLEHDVTTTYRMSIEYFSGIHPTYLSLFSYFAIIILGFSTWRNIKHQLPKVSLLSTVAIIYLFISTLYLGSRLPFVAFVVALMLVLLFSNQASLRLKVIGCLLFITLPILGIYSNPALKNRLTEVFATEIKPPVGNNHNSTNVRYGILMCTVELIKENPISGIGIGDTQDELNACYQQFETPIYQEINLNTHNTYLDFWLTAGILGFIAILVLVVISIWYHRKTPEAFAFILLFAIATLSENYLDRQLGVVFFALFNGLFFVSNTLQKNNT